MTLYIKAPAKLILPLTDIYDQPVMDGVVTDNSSPDYGKPKQATQHYRKFLFSRLSDPGFYEHGGEKKGIDAQELIHLARGQIRALVDLFESGAAYGGLDDEIAKRTQHTIIKPKNGFLSDNLVLEHNWYEWVLDWKTLLTSPPAVLAEPTGADTLVAP